MWLALLYIIVASSIVNTNVGMYFNEEWVWSINFMTSFRNNYENKSGVLNGNRAIQKVMQSRIIGRFWSILATSLTVLWLNTFDYKMCSEIP